MREENTIVASLWIAPKGNALSNMERMCLYSFCAHGHDFHLYVYDDIANVPTDTSGGNVKICDANEILPASKIFTHSQSFAVFGDWFRWELISKKGGWYVDMDITCLQPFDFPENIIFSPRGGYANNAVMKFPSDHPLVTHMIQACASPNRIMPWDTKKRMYRKYLRRWLTWGNPHTKMSWGEAGGPRGFNLALAYFGIPYIRAHAEIFEPLNWRSITRAIDNELSENGLLDSLLENAYSIHWFNSQWTTRQWDKNGTFAEHSPYEILKRRYLPEYKK